MHYFIKNNIIHTYPVSMHCPEKREREIIRDTIPYDVEQCQYCMRYWPDEDPLSRK